VVMVESTKEIEISPKLSEALEEKSISMSEIPMSDPQQMKEKEISESLKQSEIIIKKEEESLPCYKDFSIKFVVKLIKQAWKKIPKNQP